MRKWKEVDGGQEVFETGESSSFDGVFICAASYEDFPGRSGEKGGELNGSQSVVPGDDEVLLSGRSQVFATSGKEGEITMTHV